MWTFQIDAYLKPCRIICPGVGEKMWSGWEVLTFSDACKILGWLGMHFTLNYLLLFAIWDSVVTNVYVGLCLVAQSCLTLCDPAVSSPPGFSVHENSSGKNTGVGCYAFLQGIFPTQESNQGVLHCKWILYQLNHEGSLLMSIVSFTISSVVVILGQI